VGCPSGHPKKYQLSSGFSSQLARNRIGTIHGGNFPNKCWVSQIDLIFFFVPPNHQNCLRLSGNVRTGSKSLTPKLWDIRIASFGGPTDFVLVACPTAWILDGCPPSTQAGGVLNLLPRLQYSHPRGPTSRYCPNGSREPNS
jgi:hypothetical protein